MSEHNGIKFASDLVRGLGVLTGLDDTADGVVRLGETLTPVFDAFGRSEGAYLRGERLCSAAPIITSAAGQIPGFHFVNPAGSNVIAVIQSVRVSADVAGNIQLWVRHPIAGGPIPAATFGFRDLRLGPTITPRCQMQSSVPAAVPVIGQRLYNGLQLASTTVELLRDGVELVIPPDLPAAQGSWAVYHTGPVGVINMLVSVSWRERQAYPRELR